MGDDWYVADLVEQIIIEGDPRSVVNINTTLVRADSAEAAYEVALALGREGNREYDNALGRRVRITFRGLRHLALIHDELEHGAEITYEQKVSLSDEAIANLVRPRDALPAFQKAQPDSDVPNYMPGTIAEMMQEDGIKLPSWLMNPGVNE